MWNGNPIPCNPCQRLISDWISEQAAARSGPVALTCFFGHVQMVNLEQLWLWLLFLSLGIFALIFSMFHLFFLSHFKQNTITRVFRMNIPIHCLCDHIYLRERSDDAPLVVSRLLAGRMGREESREHRMDTSWWVDNTRRICQGKDRIGRQRQEGKEQGKQEGKCVSCVKRCSTLFNQDESCGQLQTPTYGSCGFWICVFAGVCTGLLSHLGTFFDFEAAVTHRYGQKYSTTVRSLTVKVAVGTRTSVPWIRGQRKCSSFISWFSSSTFWLFDLWVKRMRVIFWVMNINS